MIVNEETRDRQRLARTRALVVKLEAEAWKRLGERVTMARCAAKDLRLELDPEASDAS